MQTPSITDWIGAASAIVSALAVVGGLFYAHIQLSRWKNEARQKRRSEAAEQTWVHANNICDQLRSIRHPFSQIPKEFEHDRAFVYRDKLKRINDIADDFSALRESQLVSEIVLDDNEINEAIRSLFKIRMDLVIALQEMAEYTSFEHSEIEEGVRERLVELRHEIFGTGGDKDKLGKRLDAAIETLRGRLKPHVSFH